MVWALGSGWFLFLALVVGQKGLAHAQAMSIADFSPTGWPTLLATVCLFLFYLSLWWLMLVRSEPAARTGGVLPSLTAFVGGYLPWSIVLFGPAQASTSQSLASAALLLTGNVLMVVCLCYLGRSFSIVPQARRLVQTGPYAIVRNPLYLVEEIAMLAILLQYYSLAAVVLFLAHGALQICRIFYEENLLRQTFADYAGYERSTSRLIPYVW